METIRQTAVPSRISDILNGTFIRKEGMDPSYVITKFGARISRTKISGVIVDKFMSEDGNYSSITIDDGSDAIRVKAFKEESDFFDKFEKADNVVVIGRVREYNGENYILPEIIRKVDVNYENYHKLKILKDLIRRKTVYDIVKKHKDKFSDMDELKKFILKKYNSDEKILDGILENINSEVKKIEKDYKPIILELIEKLDTGKGVSYKKLLDESKIEEGVFQEALNDLLLNGVCYEPKPGYVKKV
ncbi:MAG: OB-fold nucleic acid binding domain-containing protein [Candidatus Aenigmatarchaeota archaeon]